VLCCCLLRVELNGTADMSKQINNYPPLMSRSFPLTPLTSSGPILTRRCRWLGLAMLISCDCTVTAMPSGVSPGTSPGPVQVSSYRHLQVAILESCRDRNIVQFLGSCTEGGQTLLITE
jgi:hypothetical protein